MDFFELINARESCRSYTGEAVSRDDLAKIIGAARLAPSACNSQPWSFVAVESAEKRAEVARCLQGAGMNRFLDKAGAFIAVVGEPAYLIAEGGGLAESDAFALHDAGLATAHLVLAARELGLGSCIIGWMNEGLPAALGLPADKRIVVVVALGHTEPKPPRIKKRKELDELVKYI